MSEEKKRDNLDEAVSHNTLSRKEGAGNMRQSVWTQDKTDEFSDNKTDMRESIESQELKILNAKPLGVRGVGAPTTKTAKLNRQGGARKRVAVLNQTNGGMQPWHKMQKQGGLDNESDGILSRYNDAIDNNSEGNILPAEFDGGILLLDADEAI